ncbi:glycosyltransferase family A protein [Sinorhizobium chiapasense]
MRIDMKTFRNEIVDTGRLAPFFTIIIPTRNRPEYVCDAVSSILEQSFSDFELIISDNSSDEVAERNKYVLSDALQDSRVRYVRPEKELAMVAHWEWAVSHARGHYVGIVTDRMALRLYALNEVHRIARSEGPDAVCYNSAVVREGPGYRKIKVIASALTAKRIRSGDMIRSFSRGELKKGNPRFLNSFVKSATIEGIRKKYGSVFSGLAPDYAFLFRFLDTSDEYVYIPETLLLSQGEDRSNGRAFKTGMHNQDSRDFLRKIEQEQSEWLRYGPIKNDVFLLSNVVLREYDIVKEINKNTTLPAIDLHAFFRNSVEAAIATAEAGSLSWDAVKALAGLAEERGFGPLPDVLLQQQAAHRASRPLSTVREVLAKLTLPLRLKVETALFICGLSPKVSSSRLMDALRIDGLQYQRRTPRDNGRPRRKIESAPRSG